MADRGIGGHQSHRMIKNEWLTPKFITDQLGPFDLDPCAPIERPWDIATNNFTIVDNGLVQPWAGFVWCNPPYGTETGHWLAKLKQHIDGGIALIFARTETEMFVSQVWRGASALMFLYGRLHFYHSTGERADNNSGGPSVLLAYGDLAVTRLKDCSLSGALITEWKDQNRTLHSAAVI